MKPYADIADSAAQMLRDGGMDDVFTSAVSTVYCAEPTLVLYKEFKREARFGLEERGQARVKIVVCRERSIDALAAVSLCEHILRTADWEHYTPSATMRVVALDTDAPGAIERDSSGRFTCDFTSYFTVNRLRENDYV